MISVLPVTVEDANLVSLDLGGRLRSMSRRGYDIVSVVLLKHEGGAYVFLVVVDDARFTKMA